MRAIDKFILHVVHNWTNELNEAYSENAIKTFINKFSEEADDLNMSVSEEQLRKYIERFDTLKNSPKITEKDLNKWSLSKLIRLVTSTKGVEVPEEAEYTPDVVYNEDGLVIYNGSKEENCLNYGRGESWCITRGSFGNYRYDDKRKNPTFYLVKDAIENYTNIPPTIDKDAFVSIIKSTPYSKRSFTTSNTRGQQVLLVPDGESRFTLFTRQADDLRYLLLLIDYYDEQHLYHHLVIHGDHLLQLIVYYQHVVSA